MAAFDCAGLGRISAFVAVLLAGLPALAGSATAESVWNRANALERARQQVPAGATITREHCQEIWVGMDNIRYRCSVEWQQPPPLTSIPPPQQPNQNPARIQRTAPRRGGRGTNA
jgi:hypothetical protein